VVILGGCRGLGQVGGAQGRWTPGVGAVIWYRVICEGVGFGRRSVTVLGQQRRRLVGHGIVGITVAVAGQDQAGWQVQGQGEHTVMHGGSWYKWRRSRKGAVLMHLLHQQEVHGHPKWKACGVDCWGQGAYWGRI